MSKFSDDTCEALYEMSLNGCLDGECGDISTIGEWYGLLVDSGIEGAEHAILREDGYGFVDYDVYESEGAARAKFDGIEGDILREREDEDNWE